MPVKSRFTKEFRLTFAGALHELLHQPKSIGCRPLCQDYRKSLKNPDPLIVVKGRLPLRQHGESGETIVGIELLIWPVKTTHNVLLSSRNGIGFTELAQARRNLLGTCAPVHSFAGGPCSLQSSWTHQEGLRILAPHSTRTHCQYGLISETTHAL